MFESEVNPMQTACTCDNSELNFDCPVHHGPVWLDGSPTTNNINIPELKSDKWLGQLRIRYAEAWFVLSRLQPYMGDKKLLLAHDLGLVARDLFKHIAALTQPAIRWELGPDQWDYTCANNHRPIQMRQVDGLECPLCKVKL